MNTLSIPTLLNVVILAMSAFSLAWIGRQVCSQIHGWFAVAVRVVAVLLAMFSAFHAWRNWTGGLPTSGGELILNVLALLCFVATIVVYYRQTKRL